MVRPGRTAALILITASLVLPAAASAQQEAATLAPRVTEAPELGVSSAGDAVVAWFAPIAGQAARQRGIGSIFMASRTTGGRFGTPRRLVPAGHASHTFALAVGAAADAAIVLRRRGSYRQPGGALLVARRAPGGRFGALTTVPGPEAVNRPAAAVGADGTLLVAWLVRTPGRRCGSHHVYVAVARRGQPFGPARRASGRCSHAKLVRAALGVGGRGAVAWLETPPVVVARREMPFAVIRAAPVTGGRLSPAGTVSRAVGLYIARGGVYDAFDLAAGRDGRALVVWRDHPGGAWKLPLGRVLAATVGPDGSSSPVPISTSEQVLGGARVAVAPSGAALVTWQERDTARDASSVFVARRAAGAAAFAMPENVHPCGITKGLTGAVPALASGGDAAVAFRSSCLGAIALTRSSAGAPFEDAVRATGRYAGRVRLALADAGPGVIAWTERDRLLVAGL